MDLKTLARYWGIQAQSVLEHKRLDGADWLRVDFKREAQWWSQVSARTAAEKNLPLPDIFQADYTLDGLKSVFNAMHADKHRELGWTDPDDETQVVPGWRIYVESYPPVSAYGAAIERISFFTFDFQDEMYDLASERPDPFTRPEVLYSLAYVTQTGDLYLITKNADAGKIEVSHRLEDNGRMRVSAAFNNVVFHMPNCHEQLPASPNRPFDVVLTTGFYELMGEV